ncbi:MAG: hypothetical protein ABEJ98_05300 [Candidatus Nanohaloarchaea archaeon]
MDLEGGYIEFILQFSLAMFAGAAAYFFDPGNAATAASLLPVTVLFGYTAYLSSERFHRSSLLGFIALIFVPLGTLNALISIVIAVGNVMVSFFASGESFKDYYTATSVPLLLTGLIIGAAVFGLSASSSGFQRQVENTTATALSGAVEESLQQTRIIEMQEEANRAFLKKSSAATVQATRIYVVNRTKDSLNSQQLRELNTAFDSASEKIPSRLAERSPSGPKALQISERVEEAVRNLLKPAFMVAFIPVVALFFYALQPLTGLLTAIAAKLFEVAER